MPSSRPVAEGHEAIEPGGQVPGPFTRSKSSNKDKDKRARPADAASPRERAQPPAEVAVLAPPQNVVQPPTQQTTQPGNGAAHQATPANDPMDAALEKVRRSMETVVAPYRQGLPPHQFTQYVDDLAGALSEATGHLLTGSGRWALTCGIQLYGALAEVKGIVAGSGEAANTEENLKEWFEDLQRQALDWTFSGALPTEVGVVIGDMPDPSTWRVGRGTCGAEGLNGIGRLYWAYVTSQRAHEGSDNEFGVPSARRFILLGNDYLTNQDLCPPSEPEEDDDEVSSEDAAPEQVPGRQQPVMRIQPRVGTTTFRAAQSEAPRSKPNTKTAKRDTSKSTKKAKTTKKDGRRSSKKVSDDDEDDEDDDEDDEDGAYEDDDDEDANERARRKLERAKDRERAQYAPKKFFVAAPLKHYYQLWAMIMFALHLLTQAVFDSLRELVLKGDVERTWGTSLRLRYGRIHGASQSLKKETKKVQEWWLTHTTVPDEHPDLCQDVMSEIAALYMLTRRQCAVPLRHYLIMGRLCTSMDDALSMNTKFDGHHVQSYVNEALRTEPKVMHGMRRGWTFEEMIGLDLTGPDERDLSGSPASLGGPQLGGILSTARTVIPDDSISRAGRASVVASVAPSRATAPRTTAYATNGPRRRRDEFTVGQLCPPLLPGERNPRNVEGPLSVNGLCGACCLALPHRRQACQLPHRDYKTATPMSLLGDLANGRRKVGGEPA